MSIQKVLIIAEHKAGKLKHSCLELLTVAKGLDISAIIFGSDAEAAAKTLSQSGAAKVFWVKSDKFNSYLGEAFRDVTKSLIETQRPQLVLANSTSLGKDLLPRLAASFRSPFVADCTELQIQPELKLARPFFSGKAMASVQLASNQLAFVSLRPNSVLNVNPGTSSGSVEELSSSFDFAASKVSFLERTQAVNDRPDLSEASRIISGGRSMKSKENFKILYDCADTLGAAVGASRAAVDEGLASHDMQVGQTGKTVNPQLYIACGISGAIQHLAGMRTSKVIVAINKDANAAIFQKADYGVVGDLFEVVPALTEELKKALKS